MPLSTTGVLSTLKDKLLKMMAGAKEFKLFPQPASGRQRIQDKGNGRDSLFSGKSCRG